MSLRRGLLVLFVMAGIAMWWIGSSSEIPESQPVVKPPSKPQWFDRRLLASAPDANQPLKRRFPEISLIDPGAEPRSLLRLQIQPGSRQELILDLRMDVAAAFAQHVAPRVKMPSMRIQGTLEVTGVTEEGDAHAEFTIQHARLLESPGVMPGLAKAMRDGVTYMEGYRGYLVVDERGRTREAEFDAGDELPEHIRQLIEGLRIAMDQLAIPLPEEPVGTGASWVVMAERNPLGVVAFDQSVTYQLKRRRGEELTLAFEVLQTAEPQPVEIPNLPEGARVKLSSYGADGAGNSIIELTQLLPHTTSLEMSSELQMTVTFGALREPAAVFTDIALDIQQQ